MKHLKLMTSKTIYFVFVLLATFSFSCSPEDGADGAQGPEGAVGQNGVNGIDGVDGANGQDGVSGQDGNANVSAYTYNISGDFPTSSVILDLPITIDEDTNDNIASLVYLGDTNGNTYYNQVPGIGSSSDHQTYYESQLNNFFGSEIIIDFLSLTGSPFTVSSGVYSVAKVILVESTATIQVRGAAISTKEVIHKELKNAGVDISNYYEVCEYYGIAH